MEPAIQWLNRASFQGKINLPANFKLSVFDQYLTDLEEIDLLDLVGQDNMDALLIWLEVNPAGVVALPENQPNPVQPLYELIVPFLVYSVYAEYLFSGDVQPTDTGAVQKDRDSSSGLTDTNRAQLHNSYRARATRRANLIREYIAKQKEACRPIVSSSGGLISFSRGKTRSKFDNC